VPGAPFYAEAPKPTRLRLAVATASAEQIGEGIRRLGDCIRDEFESKTQPEVRMEQLS
jgi:2-aminoadipate transaminase